MLSTSLLSTQHHVNTRDPAWSRVQLCFGMYRKVFTAKHSGSTQQGYEDMSPINHSLGDGPPVRLSDLRLYYMLEYISPASYFCPFFSVVPSSTSDCDRTLPCVDRGSVMVHRCPLCTKRSTAPCAVSCNRHANQRPRLPFLSRRSRLYPLPGTASQPAPPPLFPLPGYT